MFNHRRAAHHDQLYEALKKAFEKYSVQFSRFTSDEKAKIVMGEIGKDMPTITAIYNASQKRFKKQYKVK